MLISKKHKKLLLRSRNPARIMSVIPTARILNHKGAEFVVVPHRLDEVRVLRNIGISAPSPIAYYYDWSGRYRPFKHQQSTAEFLTLNPRAFVLNQIGTGKTMSVLWAVHYLMETMRVRKVLIVSPLSTLERVWADEVFRNFPDLTAVVLHGSAERRRKLLALDADIYVINHDGLKVLYEELQARTDIDLVVIDELAEYRNASTDRWKTLNGIIKDRSWVWGLTGSPTPKAPTDAWAQCRLLAPEKVPKYYGRFRDMVMRQVTTYKWTPRNEAKTIVHAAMQPSIIFTRDECLDLPPCTYSTRTVPLGDAQQKAYKDMLTKLKSEFAGGEITAVNDAVKAMKLVQIACGVAYDNQGEDVIFPAEGRVNAAKEIIEQAEGKVILYVPLTGGLNLIADELRADGKRVGVVYGGTPKTERDSIFAEFQNPVGSIDILVAHPKCMSHGLTLTSASVIIWYIPTNDFSVYEQACGRIIRQGQTRHQHIIHLEGSPVERRMYMNLENRDKQQSVLLNLFRDEQAEANKV